MFSQRLTLVKDWLSGFGGLLRIYCIKYVAESLWNNKAKFLV